MSSINLILGSHNSQILDLSEADQRAQYEYGIKPFLKLLYNRRDLNFTLYYSGLLLEWLEKHHSEFVDVLMEMVRRKQVELLGGAFFEPLLPLIPKTDRIGQIERMTTHVRKCFGRRPRGAWVPESVWDQRIAASLNTGGLDYVLLRESVFGGALPPEKQFWPVLTEDQGKTLIVLPVAHGMSETLFQQTPEQVIAFLKGVREANPVRKGAGGSALKPLVALMFDGIRAGYTPDQSASAMVWYERFLDLVTANRDWIHVDVPGRILQNERPVDRAYAPASTVAALMDWLPKLTPGEHGQEGTVQEEVVQAGAVKEESALRAEQSSFRSIMEMYPESARLYARMQHTHVLVNQIRGDKYRKMTAREELWRGQSHFAYWPNNSGGIYRANLRKATYAALIEAEKTTRERGIFIPAISRVDVDLDGREEVLYQGNEINAYLHRFGARLFELDWISRNWNYLDTFQRCPEDFHDEATVTAGYDRWPRAGFVDHLLLPENRASQFARGDRRSLCDISSLEYRIASLDKDHNAVTFLGTCRTEDTLVELTLQKRYRFIKNRIEVEYEIENTGMETLEAAFAVELNLSFHSLEVDSLRLHVRQGRLRQEIAPDMTELQGVSDIQFHDLRNSTRIQVNPSERPDLWSFPVEAVGLLGDRLHWFYQSNCSVFRWPLNLSPGESRRISLSMKIEQNR
ncbi:alpha-amylase/4-alpha-glucanotransferase domain-containing protein [Alkalispirochaeta alkalica]|uniref:alpha-amylase/4-alpha-glucanotransferase domain-containing protein n=1 Tax=Alkalispirochaeta alkalica TaxID=46356 RepID=UPI000380B2B4|nr:alpha-amylase/4-alpha-glucanotransferase domain-containing protein [Alkalispirochaeta alkalica]